MSGWPDRSVEKMTARALRRVTFWRFVQIVFSALPFPFAVLAALCRTFASVFDHVCTWFSEARNAIYALEVEQARRYESLTGVRLGPAIGQPMRYTDIHDPSDGRFPVTTEGNE